MDMDEATLINFVDVYKCIMHSCFNNNFGFDLLWQVKMKLSKFEQ